MTSGDDDHTRAFIDALIPDMPLLMMGSGDVHCTQVDPATAELLAILTVEYTEKLVKAAVDAHDILTDGSGGILPIPSFKKKRQRDDWESDLPIPRIKNKKANNYSPHCISGEMQGAAKEYAKGVDLYANRIRSTYSSIPSAMGVQNFLFPICHDAEIYGKVKDNQEFKVEVDRVLLDSAVTDFIAEEEEGFDHLAKSVFQWAFVPAAEDGEKGEQRSREKGEQRSIAARKEMARRLSSRTGLSVKMPGSEDLLLPMHCKDDHSETTRTDTDDKP